MSKLTYALMICVLLSLLSVGWSFYRPQRSWGKVMFSQACVILFTGECLPQCMLGYHPPGADTPQSRHIPLEQTPPPGSRHPPCRHPPRADIPPQEQTPQRRHSPGADTPVGTDTPWSRPPPQSRCPWEQTPPSPHPTPPLGDTVNARAVRILLECNLVIVFI